MSLIVYMCRTADDCIVPCTLYHLIKFKSDHCSTLKMQLNLDIKVMNNGQGLK